jgi:menaquinol-cytochrome c reductase iron-sulfur subunit
MPAPSRRHLLYQIGSAILGTLIALILAVPGVAYILDPLRKRAANASASGFQKLPVTLNELPIGQPRQFPIIDARTDAWVKYPAEPVGSVWLIRQPDGHSPQVLAFTAECPHLGCAVNLGADGTTFFCPCHTSSFTLEGKPTNSIPPRPMDSLEVAPIASPASPIEVKFQRFRTGVPEKHSLA